MKITRINHVAFNIHGTVEAAHAFYTELLGLPEVPIQLPGRPPIPKSATQGSFWLELERFQMHAIAREKSGEPRDPSGTHVSWYVADIEETVQHLASRGVERRTFGQGRDRIVWISDPAGNTVEFQQDPER